MRIKETRDWLTQHTLPLWLARGVDQQHGGFLESLSFEGKPMDLPKRGMVQARQIYSFRIAQEIGCVQSVTPVIERAVEFWVKSFSLTSGAFIHAAQPDGKAHHTHLDLYNQSFSLFGLAQAFILKPDDRTKKRAIELVQYLKKERRSANGGFTELQNAEILFEANPHMHLFEAAVTWMEADSDPLWQSLAEEIIELCLLKFIETKTGLLAEHFNENWEPLRNPENAFVFEPGHHYEWSWLMGRYQKLTHRRLSQVRLKLFETAEKHGVSEKHKAAYDEVWSNFKVKKHSMRFWPQCERIKVALQLGEESTTDRAHFAKIADEALDSLFEFLNTPISGLWFDSRSESGELNPQPVKASSLYHIIGAMAEYLRVRPTL